MIQKIVCPTDFSSVASNAIEYAAKFANHAKAALTLLHVQKLGVGEGINLFAGGERESVHDANMASRRLEDICLETKRTFNIECNFEIIGATLESFVSVIVGESPKYDLTIIGTSGEDNINQFYFGSHSYRVARMETGAIIIVPEASEFTPINNLVVVADNNSPERLSFDHLKQFTRLFQPAIHVLYFSDSENQYEQSAFADFCNQFEEVFNNNKEIYFEKITSENQALSLEIFAKKINADMIALYMEENNPLIRMTREDLIQTVSATTNFPLFVFHK